MGDAWEGQAKSEMRAEARRQEMSRQWVVYATLKGKQTVHLIEDCGSPKEAAVSFLESVGADEDTAGELFVYPKAVEQRFRLNVRLESE